MEVTLQLVLAAIEVVIPVTLAELFIRKKNRGECLQYCCYDSQHFQQVRKPDAHQAPTDNQRLSCLHAHSFFFLSS
ncbi:hypothetical protein H5410_031231 [Solanum commersonii]|uniref:Uncharacterized protein n=1 Tax=Solanum commersonii TaxID=4109 RepID=A0A9J5YIJ3_SOLCO|nr:hypothetical protein H5410_031231 [Solanum commersonii]